MPGRTSEPVQIYQIKVTLGDSRPAIWRRIQVRSDITLAKLHRILQFVMGWQDAHLHEFVIESEHYDVPDQDDVRSPTVAISYLYWCQGWDLDTAVTYVKERRLCSPNVEAIRLAVWASTK